MRAVVQRVSSASVNVAGELISQIGRGFMVLLGITHGDCEKDIEYIAQKIVNLRVFEDPDGKMNLSISDVGGQVLLISQFTLYGDARQGRRPSYIEAARPEIAEPIYEKTLLALNELGINAFGGVFGADMQVSLVNDGPVTLLIDSAKTF